MRYTDPTGHALDAGCETIGCKTNTEDLVKYPTGDNTQTENDSTDADSGEHQCDSTSCDLQYYSLSLGIDVPAVMILTGAGVSLFQPEIGVPVALAGMAFEMCALTASPLCAAVKLASVEAVLTVDRYGNIYLGPQIAWGKSILPIISVGFNAGTVITEDKHIVTESELEQNLSGFSVGAGTIATGGLSFSPGIENPVSYYFVGFPELFSINFSHSWQIYDR
jgi:hypothetical protein